MQWQDTFVQVLLSVVYAGVVLLVLYVADPVLWLLLLSPLVPAAVFGVWALLKACLGPSSAVPVTPLPRQLQPQQQPQQSWRAPPRIQNVPTSNTGYSGKSGVGYGSKKVKMSTEHMFERFDLPSHEFLGYLEEYNDEHEI